MFADAKPCCACEHETLSALSPGLIVDDETIVRMVCAPMHVHKKKPELLASFFAYAFSRGASCQRLEQATDVELTNCVRGLLATGQDRVWLGYVQASAAAIRAIGTDGEQAQDFCVADAAIPDNSAHAEVHSSRRIPEADRIEYRAQLLKVFQQAGVQHRKGIRAGAIWNGLDADLQGRVMPNAWAGMA